MNSSNWKEENNMLQASFVVGDFKGALEFVNKVGEIAEELEHHPDICIKNYNQVTISTTTHDKGAVTEKDQELTRRIDELIEA